MVTFGVCRISGDPVFVDAPPEQRQGKKNLYRIVSQVQLGCFQLQTYIFLNKDASQLLGCFSTLTNEPKSSCCENTTGREIDFLDASTFFCLPQYIGLYLFIKTLLTALTTSNKNCFFL